MYNTTPSANITYPIISWNIYSWNLPINWNIIDPANQDFPMNADVYYSNNNLTYFPIASTTSDRTGSLSRDTSTVPDWINYRVRLRVLDDYGNYTTTSLPFKIDNTGPIITWDLSYTINEWNNVTFSLTGTTDAIAWLSWFIRDINNNLTWTSSGQISLTWSQLQSFWINNDGIYTIPVKAYDTLWNISTKNIILSINNIAPTLTISQPVSGVYSWSTPIVWTTNDVANWDLPLWIKISYSNWTNSWVIIQSTWLSTPYLWNTSLIPDWTGYIITIDSSDDDSTTTRSSQTIHIDNTSPIISWFNNNYIINEWSGLVIDLRNSTDNIAWLSWWYSKFIGTVNWVSLPVSTNWYRTINWSSLATYGISNWYGQSYNINISISDAVWNISNKSWTLIVNNVTPSILITNPVTTTLTGTISILFTVIDPADTNMNVIIEYAPDPTLTWNIIWTGVYPINTWLNRNTTTIPDNSYYIRVRAIDDQNTWSTIAGPFNIDNIPNYVWGGGGSAWWSSWVPNKDYCPNWDFTTSFYDNSCWSQPIITTWVNQTWEENDIINFIESDIFNPTISDWLCFNRNTSLSITNSKTTITNDEFKKALTFLYSYKMTSFNTIDTFKPYTKLTREQAAKIFSNFAMNVLCRKPDTSLQPSYNDINNSNETLKPYIVKAYQLWLMKWWNNNNFRPFDTITKAELNAVLVRMILKSYLNEEWEVWYAKYNQTATKLWIITKWAWSIPVNRHDATLMMFRAYKNQDYSLQNINYESYVIDNRNQLIQ